MMTKYQRTIGLSVVVLLALAGSLFVRPTQALESGLTRQIMRAVVQLGPVVNVTDEDGETSVRFFGWGSGTILTKDGYILTNHHVTDMSSLVEQVADQPGMEVREGELVVLLTKRSDHPPVPTYIAEVLVASDALDLAILRVKSDLSGKPVDPDSLELPFVEQGDSDELEIAMNINIFGYPGIGGNTITFTSGNVSGFDSEKGVKGRAWIKTDAAISGGNSGGTSVDDNGKLIGVPTRIFSNKEGQSVDCRRLADTNGDGQIDEDDTCIPVGGFINALRPVNLAKPLFEEARSGKTNPDPNPNPPDPEGGVRFTGVIVDANTGKPIPNAIFLVLQEGVTWDTFEETEDEILGVAQTDRRGQFEMSEEVERGKTYSVGWGARGYQAVRQDDVLIDEKWPDVVEVKLKLQKQ
jgi:S1-C subfamily serine protease